MCVTEGNTQSFKDTYVFLLMMYHNVHGKYVQKPNYFPPPFTDNPANVSKSTKVKIGHALFNPQLLNSLFLFLKIVFSRL